MSLVRKAAGNLCGPPAFVTFVVSMLYAGPIVIVLVLLQHAASSPRPDPAGTFRSIDYYVLSTSAHDRQVAGDVNGTSHSQAGQDLTVQKLLGDKPGYFVDLASNDPIKFSNSRMLERDFGWEGVCIEGSRSMLHKLLTAGRKCKAVEGIVRHVAHACLSEPCTYLVRPACLFMNGTQVTGGVSGGTVHFASPNVGHGDFSPTVEVNDSHMVGGIVSAETDNKEPPKDYQTTSRTTVTLEDILDHVHAPRMIDYLSLDIEGAEWEAMRQFSFEKYEFRVITVERPGKSLEQRLWKYGYKYVMDHGCFGDQMWVHASLVHQASKAFNISVRFNTPQPCTCHPVCGPQIAHMANRRAKLTHMVSGDERKHVGVK